MDQLSLLKSIVSDISGILKSEDFLNAHRFPHCFVRKRKLSVYHVVTYLLYSTRQAMHNNISRIIKLGPVQFPDVTKQAVSKARQGIMPSLFRELFDLSRKTLARQRKGFCCRRFKDPASGLKVEFRDIRGNVQQGKSGKALVPGACIIDLRRQQRLYLPWTPPSVSFVGAQGSP